jgi:hypothetical protein
VPEIASPLATTGGLMRHNIKIFYTISSRGLMPLLSFFFKKFMDTRSLREQRAFEIYMSLLTIEDVTKEEQKRLAKFAYNAAKNFEEAIDDETIGIEDIGEKLKFLKENSGVSIRSQ